MASTSSLRLMQGRSHMPELFWMTRAPRSTLTTRSNSWKRSSGEMRCQQLIMCVQMLIRLHHTSAHNPVFEQAFCGGVRPRLGHQRAADQRGPAGVPWRDEGQLQGPGPGAVKHHARTGNDVGCIVETFFFLHCPPLHHSSAHLLTVSPVSSLFVLAWADWMVNSAFVIWGSHHRDTKGLYEIY